MTTELIFSKMKSRVHWRWIKED